MKIWQIKLTPLSPFHGFPSSDTLFGALCWGIKRIYNESLLTEMLEGFQENPKFIISSAFPCVAQNVDSIFFLPKPIMPGLSASDVEKMAQTNEKKEKVEIITQYKKFKKSEYVSQVIFNRLLNGLSEKVLFQNIVKFLGR